MDPNSRIDSLVRRLEQVTQVFLNQFNLRLVSGQVFSGVRFSSEADWKAFKHDRDVFFILLYFKSLIEVDSDFDALKIIPIAAGQWGSNTITYSLIDGPPMLVDFLHKNLGFGVSAVREKFEEFRGDYERIAEKIGA